MTTTHILSGILIPKHSGTEVDGLRIELRDAEEIVDHPIAVAISDPDGRFAISLSTQDALAVFGGRPPVTYFRVVKGDRDLLADTSDAVTWQVNRPAPLVRIPVGDPIGTVEGLSQLQVTGVVYDAETGPLAGLAVIVRDVTVAGWSAGEELGRATTDAQGRYRVRYDQSATIAGKERPDLQVNASDGDEVDITSEVYCQAPAAAVIDLVVGGDVYRGVTRYKQLSDRIGPALASERLDLLSDAQLEQLACSSRSPLEEVRAIARASAIAVDQPTVELNVEVLYGLIRQGLPDERKALLSIPRHQLRAALRRAKGVRQIAEMSPEALEVELDVIRDAVVELAKEPATGTTTCNLDDVLAVVLSSSTDRDAFHTAYAAHESTMGDFWDTLDTVAGLTSQQVADTQLVLQWGALSRYYLPLISHLNTERTTWPTLEHLAALDEADWLAVLDTLSSPGFPDGIPGGTEGEQRANYASLLTRTMESAMPTRAIAGRVRKEDPGGDLDIFFTDNPSFDLQKHRVAAFWPGADLTNIPDPEDQEAVRAQLGAVERLFKVAPRYAEMKALLDDGFASSRSIVRFGRKRFVEKYGTALGTPGNAKRVFDQAQRQAAAATFMHLWFNPQSYGPPTTYTQVFDGSTPPASDLIADWDKLFGSADDCRCDDPCLSILSPPAYLENLLTWTGWFDSTVEDGASGVWTAKELLIGTDVGAHNPISGRRPDIGHLVLRCDDPVMPYIDMVNELLEWRLTNAELPDRIETSASADELVAVPEILKPTSHAQAYDILAEGFYPWILPYSLHHHQARVYLDHLGLPRHVLMEGLQRASRPTQIADCRLWLRADLGVRVDGEDILEWLDLSGHGNDARKTPAAGTPVRGRHGSGDLPYLAFTGAEVLQIGGAGSLDLVTGSGGTVVVVASDIEGGPSQLVRRGSAYGISRTSGGDVEARYTSSTSSGPSWPADAPAASVAMTILEASQTTFRIDGAETVEGSETNQLVETSDPFHIGARPDGLWPTSQFVEHLTGRIYEVIVYSRALSASEIADLETYLLTRYGSGGKDVEPTSLQIAQERLTMTATERAIIVGAPPAPADEEPWTLWGYDTDLPDAVAWEEHVRRLSRFRDASGLTLDAISELLDSRFLLEHAASEETPHLEPEDEDYEGCDPDLLLIGGLEPSGLITTWDQVQRFLRLRRRLGWKIRELDKVWRALSDEGAIDDALVEQLGHVKALRERFGRVPLAEMASWWAPLDVVATPSRSEPSLYTKIFLNRAVANPPLAAFENLTGTELLADHLDHVLASIRMRAEDHDLLTNAADARARLCLGVALDEPLLTLTSLSRLHRIASFSRASGLKVADLRTVTALSGLAPLLGDGEASPAETLRFIAALDRLQQTRFTVPEAHYLVRHVPRSRDGVAAEDVEVARRLTSLEGQLASLVAATTYQEDPTGKSLRALLSQIIASDNPELPPSYVAADVDIVMGILDGSRLLADDAVLVDDHARRNALERILTPYITDLASIQEQLLFRPWNLEGCQLWLDPTGIVHDSDGTVTGWLSTIGTASVRQPLLSELDGCQLWLRADAGVEEAASDPAEDNDPVQIWLDQSGAGHDASQPSAGARPTFLLEGLQGRPGVEFSRATGQWMDLGSISDASNDYSVFMVLDQRSAATALQAGISTFGGSFEVGFYPVADDESGKVGLADGNDWRELADSLAGPQYLTWVIDAGELSLALYRNGVLLGTTDYSGSGAIGSATQLGKQHASGQHFLDAVVAEVAIFHRVLSAQELAFVHATLAHRAGLSGPMGPRHVEQGPFALPAVRFDGAKDTLVIELSYVDTSHTFACVLRQASREDEDGVALLDVETGRLVLATSTATDQEVGFYDGTTWAGTGASVTGDQILTWVFDDVTPICTVYRDGSAIGSTAYSAPIALGGLVGLGGRLGSGVATFDGMMACVVLFNRALDDEELRQLHDYLALLAGHAPIWRYEVVEKALLDHWRLREARALIKDSLATATQIPAAAAAGLLENHLVSVRGGAAPLVADLLPPTHDAAAPASRPERLDAVMRFSKAASLIRKLAITSEELAWLQGDQRDPGWLDLNDLPVRLHGVEVFDAQTTGQRDGTLELPAWLRVECPTDGRSAQIGPSSVRIGLGPDAARAFSRDGVTWSLLMEPGRSNLAEEQDLRTWSPVGSPLVHDSLTPAATTGATDVFDDSTTEVEALTLAISDLATFSVYALSGWTWTLTAPGDASVVSLDTGGSPFEFRIENVESAWSFHSTSGAPEATSGTLAMTPRATVAADSGATRFWGTQLELGRYPTSFMGSDGMAFERAADRLVVERDRVTALHDGYFEFSVRYAPLYAHDECSAEHDLLFLDNDHRVFFRDTDRRLVVRFGGVEVVTSDALTFTRHREIEVRLIHAADRFELMVSGAGSGNGTFTAMTATAPASWPAIFSVLSGASGAQEGAALRRLSFERLDPEADLPDATRRFEGLLRLGDLFALRDRIQRRGGDLFALFDRAASPTSVSESEFFADLSVETQLPYDDLRAIAAHHRLSYPADYRSEGGLGRVVSGLEIITRLGVPATKAIDWLDVDGEGSTPHSVIAEQILRAAKAKHADADWPEIGRALRDELRTAQRDALVAKIVHDEAELSSVADLYDDLLVDPEMSPCALTSRIANAISSVQLYVHRILLGLEPVHLDRDAREQWEWRKNYRVWEANRKVLLWPENWIHPDLRDDKTPFFRALESKLKQGDVNDALAEDAYRDYVESLDEVAKVRVTGMVHHKRSATEEHHAVDELNVFARTEGTAPYSLFHRKWVNRSYWTAWEKLPFDGKAKLYLPVVLNGNLSLFWLDVFEGMAAKSPQADPQPDRIQLSASHHDQRQWSKPSVSKVFDVTATGLADVAGLVLVSKRRVTDATVGGVAVVECDDNEQVLSAVERSFAATDPCHGRHVDLSSSSGTTWMPARFWDGDAYPLYWKLAKNAFDVAWPAAARIDVHGSPVTLLEQDFLDPQIDFGETTKRTTLQYERTGGYNASSKTTKIPAPDTFVMHIDAPDAHGNAALRRLFGVFDPFPSEQGVDMLLVSPSWFNLLGTPEAKMIPYVGPQYLGSAQGLAVAIESSIHQVVNAPRPHLRYQAFSHPYVCRIRETLFRYGVAGLRDYSRLDPPLQETHEAWFDAFLPSNLTERARIQTPYPKDEMELDYGGAFSTYNWEMFFHTPMLLATWLKDASRFKEAREWLHAIFHPTDGDVTEVRDVWRFRPFRELQSLSELQHDVASPMPDSPLAKWLAKLLGGGTAAETDTTFEQQMTAWANDPFNPHLIARMRPVAYMKKTARLYIEVLVEWGDNLFRQDTVEAIVEAQQLYMLALKILGDRPTKMALPAEKATKTYRELDLSGPAIEAEGGTGVQQWSTTKPGASLPDIEIGYFCVPRNDSLLELWDVVEDRLFKIRHCMNIEGVVRQLPLFQPPIDPALLVKAKAAGVDLSSVLSDLYSPPPLHRYPVLYQRAIDCTMFATGLGQSLLAALEKQDSEALSTLRANQEVSLLEMIRATREEQVREAERSLESLHLTLEVIRVRRAHYETLIASGLSGREVAAIEAMAIAKGIQFAGSQFQAVGQGLGGIPSFGTGTSGSGAHSVTKFGGPQIAAIVGALGSHAVGLAGRFRDDSAQHTTTASYERRAQDWSLQLALAEAEIKQTEKQITAQEIRVEITRRELATHDKQIQQSREVREFLQDKYTNEELYRWMVSELQTVYYQAYKLAFDMARRAERAWQFERLEPETFFIQFGYWDGARKGLLAGEKLLLDLRKMDAKYLEKDRRDYEITKSISMAELDPRALIELRETGRTHIRLDEALFDLDYPGHYFRRLRSVSLSVPAVVGPHSGVHCTLRLLSHKIRTKSLVSDGYAEQTDNEDPRFSYSFGQVQSVCTSSGINDAGLFELSFRDDRLLPFEGAGAISHWRIELPQETNRFDLRSVTDVVVHLQYTAREGGGVLGEAARKEALGSILPRAKRLISVRHELEAPWRTFQTTLDSSDRAQVLTVVLDKKLPFVPGTGPKRLVRLHAAFDVDHADASSVALEATVDIGESSSSLVLSDAATSVATLELEDPVDIAMAALSIRIPQTELAKLPADMVEEHPTEEGALRLVPAVFRNLWLLAEIERDPPIV